jgi:speckle-type POZ protein
MPDILLVNEVEKGEWIVNWELRKTPPNVDNRYFNILTAAATFSCAGYDIEIMFQFYARIPKVMLHVISKSKFSEICSEGIILKTYSFTEIKEDDIETQVIAFHQGEQQMPLLTNDEWRFTWSKWHCKFTSLDSATRYETCYPDYSCKFQIMFKFPELMKKNSFANYHLANNLYKLLKSESHADIQFVVKGQRIAAHTAIIAASSPVFSAMLEEGKFKEAETRIIEIEDIEVEVFRQLLHYLYTGEAPQLKKPKITEPLFLAADKYQVSQLKSECEACLISNLTVENTTHHLALAHLFSASKLQEAAFDCLVEHRHKVWKRTEWKELIESYPALFYEACDRMVNHSDDEE